MTTKMKKKCDNIVMVIDRVQSYKMGKERGWKTEGDWSGKLKSIIDRK